MGSLLQVRNVSDDARRVLKARAASRGESLNSYMLALIEAEVARPTVEEVLQRAARRSGGASVSAVDTVDEARRDREVQLAHRSRP